MVLLWPKYLFLASHYLWVACLLIIPLHSLQCLCCVYVCEWNVSRTLLRCWSIHTAIVETRWIFLAQESLNLTLVYRGDHCEDYSLTFFELIHEVSGRLCFGDGSIAMPPCWSPWAFSLSSLLGSSLNLWVVLLFFFWIVDRLRFSPHWRKSLTK